MAAQAGKREIRHFALIAVFAKVGTTGDRRLSRVRPLLRVVLIAALAASMGLAACGRKGPLDPPPGASLEGEPQATMPELMSKKGQTPPAQGNAVQAPKKHIPLDGLLN
jgi:predicted small lipoprotein YifL